MGGQRKISDKGTQAADVEHPYLAPEVKHGLQIPKFFAKTYAQAKRNAPEDKIPIVVLHPKQSHEYYVLLEIKDFARIMNGEVQDG